MDEQHPSATSSSPWAHPLPGDGDDGLNSAYVHLQTLLLLGDAVEVFLQNLSRLAAGLGEPRLSCGVTLRHDGMPLTVASSDERATALDESQYVNGAGPCLHSLDSGETVWMPDLTAESRWPEYRDYAHHQGLAASLSMPLRSTTATVGAMNIYDFTTPSVLTPQVRRSCELFAAQASGALQLTLSRVGQAQSHRQLEEALTSRTVIDQALGIVMGQSRCTATTAFALLRMRSQSSNVKIRDVAVELITQVTGQPPEPGPIFTAPTPKQ